MRSNDIAATYTKAQRFVETAVPRDDQATVVGLQGDLGSGKTTFVQAMAQALGINESVTSPTFVIEKIYATTHPDFHRLVHIDAYRLESGKELEVLGWRDVVSDPHNLVVIEWPERVNDILQADTPIITFRFVDETTREITFPNDTQN